MNKKLKLFGSFFVFTLIILGSLVFTNKASAATYYVDSSITDTNVGSATPDCTNYDSTAFTCSGGSASAFKTIADINAFSALAPGDSVLFRKGQTWREKLTVPSSGSAGNPITFGAYGTGNNPIIDGANIITGMTSAGSNMWQKDIGWPQPNLMYLNGVVGTKKTSVVACTSIGDYYFDDSTGEFYVYSVSNPSGNVEIGQREKIVDLGSRQYITLNNLTIQHSNEESTPGSETWTAGLYSLGGSHLTITGCTIQKNSYFGVFFRNSSYVVFDNNTISRNGEANKNGFNLMIEAGIAGISNFTFTNNQINYAGTHGLFIVPDNKASYITNVDIHGNHFDNNNSTGLYIQKLNNVVVYDNYFDSNGDPVDADEDYAIGITSCDNTDIYQNTITNQLNNDAIQLYGDASATYGSSNNVRIFRNYISGVTNGYGIGVASEEDLTLQNLEISYNTIASADKFGISIGHTGVGLGSSVNVFNNTLINNVQGGLYASVNHPLVVRNNIFNNVGNPDINLTLSTTGFTHSNNLYYRASGNVLRFNNISYTTATIQGFESSAQNTNPLFASSSDFRLQSTSSAINTGVDVGLTTDIEGNPIIGNPDIGAYEYQPPSLNPPTLFTPSDTTTGVALNTSLTISDTNTSPNETGIIFRIKAGAGGAYSYSTQQAANTTSINAATVLGTALANNTTYYWSAIAKGDGSTTSDSAYATDFSFTTVAPLSSTKAITAFNFSALSPAVTGIVNETTKTVALTVPFGTSLTNLVPTITFTGASVNPASGATHTFVDGVSTNYTVTAADASTQIYAVTVNVAPQDTYTLNITSTNGTVTKSPDQASYDSGSSVTITATANSGYSFSGWSGDASGSTNPLTVTMDGNKSITANFTASTPTHSSSGSSVVSRFNNLIAMGNTQAAQELAGQFPNQINPTVTPITTTITITPTPIFTQTLLRQGSKGEDTKTLQSYLNTKLNLTLVIDGKFGPKTKQAVIQFQIANGLKSDGIVGPNTRGMMK